MALLVTALATVGRRTGILTLNATAPDGRPLALAIISSARWDRNKNGNTVLAEVLETEITT